MKKALTLISLISAFAIGQANAADINKGKRVWNKCKTCHSLEQGGRNKTGPNLYDIIGREAGKAEGFNYSKAMVESGITWTEEALSDYLKSPRTVVKGTKMSFPGLRKDADIENLLAYMKAEMGQ